MYVCLYIFYLFIIVYYTPKKRNRYMKASSSSSSRDSVPCYTIPHHTIFLLMVYIIYKNFPMLKIFSIIITINSTKKERRKQCCGATIKISFLFVSQLCYHFFLLLPKTAILYNMHIFSQIETCFADSRLCSIYIYLTGMRRNSTYRLIYMVFLEFVPPHKDSIYIYMSLGVDVMYISNVYTCQKVEILKTPST